MYENLVQVPVIRQLVVRQLGHVTRSQLLGFGYGDDAVQYRVARGELIPVHAGVYAVGHVPRHAHARSIAAVLACGPGAALSHFAALALYDLAPWPRTLQLTAPRRAHRPGLIIHHSRTLTDPGQTRRHHGVSVTAPIRTFTDLAAPRHRLPDDRLIRLVNQAARAGLLGPTALRQLAAHTARLQHLLGDIQRPTRSQLEDAFRRFCARHHLPMPIVNAIIHELGGREVDAHYPRHRLIVELDGYDFHKDRPTFETDIDKDVVAQLAGYATIRITWRQLTTHDARKAAQIRAILADREPRT